MVDRRWSPAAGLLSRLVAGLERQRWRELERAPFTGSTSPNAGQSATGSVAAAGRACMWQGDGAHSLANTNRLVAAQLDLVDHVMMLVAGRLRNGAGRQTSAQGRTSFSTNQVGQRIRWRGRINAQPGRKVVIGKEGGRYNERLHLSAAAAAAGQTTGAVISGPPFEERGPT